MLLYRPQGDSEEDDDGKSASDEGETIPAGTARGRMMSGGSTVSAGYEDMNRLLGRLAIQRRGCRR